MRKLGSEEDLSLEPVAAQVSTSGRRQHFDRDPAAELDVGPEVHGRHAPLPELANQAVATRERAGQPLKQRIGGHERTLLLDATPAPGTRAPLRSPPRDGLAPLEG